MLNKENSIRIEHRRRNNGGTRLDYIFLCSEMGCNKEFSARSDYFHKSTGKCVEHAQRGKPFESLFNTLKGKSKHSGREVNLTFEEFLAFTLVKECHYCYSKINWIQYRYIKNKFLSQAYYLDRKNNDLGYSVSNCVVCCTRCNTAKSSKFSYEEWYGMTQYLRNNNTKQK